MPEMDGYETLAALKADEALRDLPVIVISGVDELDSVVRCIEMGAADYLPKTVRPRDPARPDRGVAGPEAAARPERETRAERSARSSASAPSWRASCRRRSRRSCRARMARRCWPATGARSPRCSATCATSRSSPRRPSPRRCSASCARTTPRWASSSSSTRATLEHFAGDGFMTFFNDPVLQPDHAARADPAGGRDARAVRGAVGGVAPARARPRDRDRHRDRLRHARAGSASRAATTTARSATRSSWPRD